MTRIGIIRHGSTSWNKEGRAQGSSDIPLDDDGLLGASKLAERLGKEEWDFVYSSHLLRAKQTAEMIGQKIRITHVQFDQRLREVGGGQIEGTTEAERILKWGRNWRELDLGIENSESVTTRGISLIEEILHKHNSKNIIIVSHGSFIRNLLKNLVPNTIMEGHLGNTSVTRLLMINKRWECELYNCTKHLSVE